MRLVSFYSLWLGNFSDLFYSIIVFARPYQYSIEELMFNFFDCFKLQNHLRISWNSLKASRYTSVVGDMVFSLTSNLWKLKCCCDIPGKPITMSSVCKTQYVMPKKCHFTVLIWTCKIKRQVNSRLDVLHIMGLKDHFSQDFRR